MKINRLLLVSMIVITLFLSACIPLPPQPQIPAKSTQNIEQQKVEQNQQTLIKDQPAPTLTKSLERENIIRRLNLLNDQDKVFYVYLINYGKVMSFFTAKGKVSSVDSYLSSTSQIVRDDKCAKTTTRGIDINGNAIGQEYLSNDPSCYFSVEAPDLDGTYGTNGDGVFFFTTEGAYVEWHGDYMVSDFPLSLSTPPEIVQSVDGK